MPIAVPTPRLAAALAAIGTLAGCAWIASPRQGEVRVASTSRVVDAIAAGSASGDPVALYEAREVYRLAGVRQAQAALDLEIEREALARLLDTQAPAPRTIGAIVARGVIAAEAAEIRAMREALMRKALTTETVGDGGGTINVGLRNGTRRALRSAHVRLTRQSDGGEIVAECTQAGGGSDPWEPGAARHYWCRLDGKAIDSLSRNARGAGRWQAEALHLQFAAPDVSVSPEGVRWDLEAPSGAARASQRLRAASCEDRGVCALEAWDSRLRDPAVVSLMGGAFAGLAIGSLVAPLRRRRTEMALLAAGLALAAAIAWVFDHDAKNAPLLLLYAAFYLLPWALPPFVVALASALLVAGRLHARRAPAAGNTTLQ